MHNDTLRNESLTKDSRAVRAIALFTSRERAREIEGDLIEQSQLYGSAWLAANAIRIVIAYFADSVRESLQQAIVLTLVASLSSSLVCILAGRVFSSPTASGWTFAVGFVAIFAVAVLIGAGLSAVAPRSGVTASICTAISLSVIFLATQLMSPAPRLPVTGQPVEGPLNALLAIGGGYALSLVFYLGPMVGGSVYARRWLSGQADLRG